MAISTETQAELEARLAPEDWGDYDFRHRNIEVLDTSLRDGAQDPDRRRRHPSLEEKLQFCENLARLGVDSADIAMPVRGGTHFKDAVKIAQSLPSRMQVACLTRTDRRDIESALELQEKAGRQVEAIIFVGISEMRRWVEGWDADAITRWMAENVAQAVRYGIKATVATEQTTIARRGMIKQIYRAGLAEGGTTVCIADTTGHASTKTTPNIIRFFKEEVLDGYDGIKIDWHGHLDRDFGTANAFVALDAGADRIHVTALRIGERAGNTSMEAVLGNLKMVGDPKRQDITFLPEAAAFASRIFRVPIAINYPFIGGKVFDVSSGIHGNTMRKARKLGLEPLTPYSSVDPRWVGRTSRFFIGPLSGEAVVLEVAEGLGIEMDQDHMPEFVQRCLSTADQTNRILSNDDVKSIAYSVNGYDPRASIE